jgi:hypothetical protein
MTEGELLPSPWCSVSGERRGNEKRKWMEEKRCLVIRFVAWGPPCAATDADEGLNVSDIFVGVRCLLPSITVW